MQLAGTLVGSEEFAWFHPLKLGILTSDFVCAMQHALCSVRYAAKSQTYGNHVGVITYCRFSVFYRAQYVMRKNESRHVTIHTACECEFGWVNPETDITGQGFPWILTTLYRDSRSVPVSLVPTLHSTHPAMLLALPAFLKCYGPNSGAFSSLISSCILNGMP